MRSRGFLRDLLPFWVQYVGFARGSTVRDVELTTDTSFGQLQVYYLAGPLKEYSVSDVGLVFTGAKRA